MNWETWHAAIYKAVEAFRQRQFVALFAHLREAFAHWNQPQYGGYVMDNEVYNSLLDIADVLDIVRDCSAAETSRFYRQAVDALRWATEAFEQPTQGSWDTLNRAIEAVKMLVDGLWVGAVYLQKHDLTFDHFPPAISFEITRDGRIRMFGVTDSPAEGTPEAIEEEETIQYLKTEFDAMFLQQEVAQEDYLAKARQQYEAGAYMECVATLQEGIKKQPEIQREAFLLQGEAYWQLLRYADVADVLMKAYVVGIPKKQIRARIQEVCQLMLERPDVVSDEIERERWERLRDDF